MNSQSWQLSRNSFIKVESEGYYVSKFVNISTVALIEIPLEKYLRIDYSMI